jgi:hypothetical protein
MSRLAVFAAFFFLVVQAQAQIFSHGVPAGATSIEPDGRIHGVPSNVQSPTPLPPGVNPPLRIFHARGPLRRFGNPREHRRVVLPVPVFYPVYGYADPGYPADPYVQQSSDPAPAQAAEPAQQADSAAGDEALRQAYIAGARDALRDTLARDREDRYGEHYLDSREQQRAPADQQRAARDRRDGDTPAAAPAAPREDKTPATVFIFKDGHQLETRNYAIMGETLFDFSDNRLKKIKLAEIDAAATTKANDDRGVQVKLQ